MPAKHLPPSKRTRQLAAALEQQLAHLQLEADALQTVHSALSIEHEVLHGVAEGLAWLRAHLQQQQQQQQQQAQQRRHKGLRQPAASSAGSRDAALQLLQQELQLLEGLSQHALGAPAAAAPQAPTPDDSAPAFGLPVDAPSAPRNDPMRTFRRLIAAPIDADWQNMTGEQLQEFSSNGSQQLVLLLNMRDTPVYSEPQRRQELDARLCSVLNRNVGLLAHLVAGKRSRVVMQRFWTPEWVHPINERRLTQDEVEALHACALQQASLSARQLHVLATCSKLHHRLVGQLASKRVQAQAVLHGSCSDGPQHSGGSDGGCASGSASAVSGSPRGSSSCERSSASGSSYHAALLREEAEDAALQQVHYTLEKEHLLANVVMAHVLGCLSPLQCAQIIAKVHPVPFNMHLVCKAAAAQLA